jgi:1-phosphofructokinase
MIITVTANPSIDRTLYLDAFVHHGVNRVRDVLDEPNGKGVNVALALHRAGTPVCAVLPIGGATGTELSQLLAATGLPVRTVPITGSVRTNLSLVEADGSTTKINEPGPTLTSAETEALLTEAYAISQPGDWVAFCGSLPGGFPPSALRTAIESHSRSGRLVAVDTSEQALHQLLTGRSEELPHLIKPNVHELASLADQPLRTVGDVVAAAEQLRVRGVGVVLVSLGADGAVLVDRTGALHGRAPVPRVINTVGAGDALLAGYLHTRYADQAARESALANGLRWGAIAVQHAGTIFPGMTEEHTQIPVSVGPVEVARRLSDIR